MAELKKLYRWIPTLYIMQALPYALVTVVAPVLYKSFHVSNSRNAFYTSLFTLPWLCKPALAPLLETVASKRTLTIMMQFLLAGALLLLVLSFSLSKFLLASGIIFLIIALLSTVYDMNSDGFYIITLEPSAQAHFIGVRTLFYQLGKMICQGGLVFLAGYLINYWEQQRAWQFALLLLAGVILLLAIYHQLVMPKVEKPTENNQLTYNNTLNSFKNVFTEFLALPHLASVVIFVLIYNFAEAQLAKIVPLFLMDQITNFGLGLSVKEVGTIYGGIGTLGVLLGVLLSGFVLAKLSLKQCIVPVTIFVALTNLAYCLLSLHIVHSIWLIGICVAFAQFGFGLSNGAYMLYLLNAFTKGQYPMSLYAIGTALMGLSVLAGGSVSGYLQSLLGYPGFFAWILLFNFGIVFISVYNSKKVL